MSALFVTLEEAKLFLKVDGDEDNTLITDLIKTSEDLCEGILRYPLTEFITIPEAIKISMLYAIANMYEHRENADMKSVLDVMSRLLFSYRREEW